MQPSYRLYREAQRSVVRKPNLHYGDLSRPALSVSDGRWSVDLLLSVHISQPNRMRHSAITKTVIVVASGSPRNKRGAWLLHLIGDKQS